MGIEPLDFDWWRAAKPLAVDVSAPGTVPAVHLGGCEGSNRLAALATRAARWHFELPCPDADGVLRLGGKTVGRRRLETVRARKRFGAFLDAHGLLHMYYRELVVRFVEAVRPSAARSLLKAHGLSVRRRAQQAPGQYLAYLPRRPGSSADVTDLCTTLGRLPEVLFARPNFVAEFARTHALATPGAPAAQWHLPMIDPEQVWRSIPAERRRAITIAVVDDGVDPDHIALNDNRWVERRPDGAILGFGRNYFLGPDDAAFRNPRPLVFDEQNPAEPELNDIHGTACAGLARGSGPIAFGVCPEARLLPVKVFHAGELASPLDVAAAIRFAASEADVVLCAWAASPDPDISRAIQDAAVTGRKGRGTAIICATGDREEAEVRYPASLPECIAVGASTHDDRHPRYSATGSRVFVVAPSSGNGRSVFTTDIVASDRGFNSTRKAEPDVADFDYTGAFGGTSASAAMVAGLVALMLAKNDRLTLADIKAILKSSSTALGPVDAERHSIEFGYGRIDVTRCLAAVPV